MGVPRAITAILRCKSTGDEAAGLGLGAIAALGSLGIAVAPPLGAAAIGGLVVVGVGCDLYERFVSDPRTAKADKETREWVAQTRSILKESVERATERDQYHAALAEALTERAASIGKSLEELRTAEHPLGIVSEINDALRSEDDTRLERVLSVHDTFEAALARFIEREFDAIRSLLSLTTKELLEVRSLVSQIDTRLSKLDSVLKVLAAGQTLDADLLLPLDPYDPKKPPSNPFVFSLQRVPLFGRENELRQLHDFLNDSDPAPRWWLWHGPGGQGKTRLAHQLCLEARECGWAAGFLKRDTDLRQWQRLNLTKDTLVVLDYVSERAEEAAKLIARLRRTHAECPNRLRFLLLDRTDTGPWRDVFYECGGSQDGSLAVELAMHAHPVRLYPLDDEHLRRIMAIVFHERDATHDPAEAVALLKRIDADARPLYAAMLADTIVDKGLEDASTLDANQLVTCVLRNEMAKWARLGIDAPHVNAIFLASILGSFDPNDDHPAIQTLRQQGILPSKGHIRPLHWSTLRAFTGAPATNDDILPGIQPDILAECFVVQRLLGTLSLCGTEMPRNITRCSKSLLETAWARDARQAGQFSVLAIHDLCLTAVQAGLASKRDACKASRSAWASMVVDLTVISSLYRPSLRPTSTDSLEDLRDLASHYPGDTALVEYLAKALANKALLPHTEPSCDNEHMAELRALAARQGDNSAVQEALATALANAISTSTSPRRSQSLLKELRRLISTHNEPGLRTAFSNAISNSITSTSNNLTQTYSLLHELHLFTKEYDQEPSLRDSLANAYCNALTNHYTGQGCVIFIINRLRDIASENPTEANLRIWLARGIANAIAQHRHNIALVDYLLDTIRQTISGHKHDVCIKIWFAIAITNATAPSGSAPHRVAGLIDELRSLLSSCPHRDIREQLANSLANAMGDPRIGISRANAFATELRRMTTDYPYEPILREVFAKSLFNAFLSLRSDESQRNALLKDMRAIVASHHAEHVLRVPLINALNLSLAFTSSFPDKIEPIIGEIRNLAVSAEIDPSSGGLLAKALCNAVLLYYTDQIRADVHLCDLRMLGSKHPDELAVREPLARAVLLTLIRKTSTLPKTTLGECVALAEELAPLRDAIRTLLSQHAELRSGLRRALRTLLDFAERADDENCALRVIAASRTLFPE